jgi:hypothetical protein
MILRALTLENFKGIREPVRIEFAPLTLLFGPNNAGKSTIVQALMYAREVLERNNSDAGRTELGGDVVDLGGFKNLVHGHDYRTRAIRMRFELELRESGLPDYTEPVRENELESTVHINNAPTRHTFKIAKDLSQQDLWVEFEVAWNIASSSPLVHAYRVGSKEATYATIECSHENLRAVISYLNGGAHPFGEREISDLRDLPATRPTHQSGDSPKDTPPKAIRREIIWRARGWFLDLIDSLLKPNVTPTRRFECETLYIGEMTQAEQIASQFSPTNYYDILPGPMPLTQEGTALPKWGQRIGIDPDAWEEADASEKPFSWEFPYFVQQYLQDVLTTLIAGPGERLVEALKQSVYVSPFREVPTRQYAPVHSPGANRWANGMAAWDWLMLDPKRHLRETNRWLAEGRLNTGYRIEVTHYRELDTTSPLMAALSNDAVPSYPDWDWIRSELMNLQERLRLQIRHLATNTALFPRDLGVGISQVIPVIVAALHSANGVVAIEEPESNIHPAFQVVLADLLISQAKTNKGVLFLVETHSEHLMLRCLRRIRETTKGIQIDGIPRVAPEDIAVHFVEPTASGPRIRRIDVDEEGDFVDEWPGGFFEESFHEKFAGR